MRSLPRIAPNPLRRWPKLTRVALAGGALLVVIVVGANAVVLVEGRDSTASVGDAPRAEVAIVPGALVKPDGEMSTMLADRVRRAAALWEAGKVERILVSGDHGRWAYDEPGTMRRALVRQGVPGRVVFEDHAGFDTWATMVRAREIFQARKALVVTQGFHMARALYLADAAGIDASGVTADLHPYGFQGRKSGVREALSRIKAVADVALDRPAVGGPVIPISGDGRMSWGPEPPRTAPAAGAPADRPPLD
jgi:SanA protein